MFALLNKETGNIWKIHRTGQYLTFSSEKDAWRFFLNEMKTEDQDNTQIIQINWARK